MRDLGPEMGGISARSTLQIRSIAGYLHCLKMDTRQLPTSPAPGFISQDRLVRNASSVEIARNRGTWEILILTRKF